MAEKTILKLYENGNFEVVDAQVVQSGVTGNYSFSRDTIVVPSITRDANLTNPFRFSANGIVVKGTIIGVDTDGGGGDGDVIFSDTFDRANSNTLGSNWEILSGGYQIVYNVAKPTNTSSTNNIALVDIGVQDNISISCDVTVNMSESIMFRTIDDRNYMQVLIESGNLYLRTKEDNATKEYGYFQLGAINGNTYKVKVELRGTQIKIFVDDNLRITYTANLFLNATKYGMKAWSSNGIIGHFNDFEVRRLPV